MPLSPQEWQNGSTADGMHISDIWLDRHRVWVVLGPHVVRTKPRLPVVLSSGVTRQDNREVHGRTARLSAWLPHTNRLQWVTKIHRLFVNCNCNRIPLPCPLFMILVNKTRSITIAIIKSLRKITNDTKIIIYWLEKPLQLRMRTSIAWRQSASVSRWRSARRLRWRWTPCGSTWGFSCWRCWFLDRTTRILSASVATGASAAESSTASLSAARYGIILGQPEYSMPHLPNHKKCLLQWMWQPL